MAMTRRGFFIRLGVSIAIDLLNFTIGRVPIIGSVEDLAGIALLTWMWGPVGLFSLWELGDVTEQIDGFVPSATLIALFVGYKKGFIGKKEATATEPRNVTPAPPQRIPPPQTGR